MSTANTTHLANDATAGTSDDGCCTTVRSARRSQTPWPLGLALAGALLGLVTVRRRR